MPFQLISLCYYTGLNLIDPGKIVEICAMLVRDGSLSPIYRRPKRHILSVHKACMKDFSDHCVDSFVLPSPASTPKSLARALGFAELNPQYSALSIYRYIKRQSWLNASGTIAAESLLLIRTWVLLWRVLACPIGLAAACTAGSGVIGATVLRSMKCPFSRLFRPPRILPDRLISLSRHPPISQGMLSSK
ncbi:hypothetical protein BDR03DRAFT_938828 [Suillus americanus]|nr:hypothetical protein BDR03DRAFT_938828 [Suillus americanus]